MTAAVFATAASSSSLPNNGVCVSAEAVVYDRSPSQLTCKTSKAATVVSSSSMDPFIIAIASIVLKETLCFLLPRFVLNSKTEDCCCLLLRMIFIRIVASFWPTW